MQTVINYICANWHILAGGALLGFTVGVLTGLFGAGGGFIVTPALNIFLGLPMNYAVGTSACQVLGASSLTLYHQLDRNFYGIRVAALTAIGVPGGAYLGALTVGKFKNLGMVKIMGRELDAVNFYLMLIFMFFLTLIAIWLIFDNFWLRRGKDDDEENHRGFLAGIKIPPMVKFRTLPVGEFSAPLLILLGFIMGFMSGLLGIGGGVVMMPMLFYLVGQGTKFAARTGTMLIFVSGFFSTIIHAAKGNIDYALVVFLFFGAFFGTRLGGVIQKKISGKSIRKYFAFVVLAAALMVIVKIYFMLFAESNR